MCFFVCVCEHARERKRFFLKLHLCLSTVSRIVFFSAMMDQRTIGWGVSLQLCWGLTLMYISIISLSSGLVWNQISSLNTFNFTKLQSLFWCIVQKLFSYPTNYTLLSFYALISYLVLCYTVSVTGRAKQRKKENNKRKISKSRRLPDEDY